MDEEEARYLASGKILADALKMAVEKIHVGMPISELCDLVEGYIKSRAALAFPCNISINEVAAHDTADPGDPRTVPPGSVVKIDAGAHVDGYIADAAVTVSFSKKHEQLLNAAKRALRNAISNIRDGVSLGFIGKVIEKSIRLYGYRPISNLSGHKLSRYVLHAGKSVPNVSAVMVGKMFAGEAYAVEPFATNGAGRVFDSDKIRIFALKKPYFKAKREEERILVDIWRERRGLPFSIRWYKNRYPGAEERVWSLYKKGYVRGYPVLVEERGGLVSQFEVTLIVKPRDALVTTPLLDLLE